MAEEEPLEQPRSDGAEREPVPTPRCHCRIRVCLTAAQVLVGVAGVACQVYLVVHGLA
ncbi:hypothetical protein AB0H37_38105 [Actinomadura sp. NPDC023710]|uniref:hypothetical protein n=1 Tax=Actinomadura sp. NPDC023710 TaxID=3158219 RepID=UPI00340497BE